MFKRSEILVMKAYTDADYASLASDRRSTLSYCTFLCGDLVFLRGKKQNVVARQSSEAEFRAMTQKNCDLLWMKLILEDLKIQYESLKKLF